ncbi:MAG: cytochrome c family protein, partial [Pseudomonadota bacterium]
QTQAQEVQVAAVDAELIAAGEKVFKKCKACHQVGEGAKNKVGPILNGIVGASLGAVDGFKYSKALKAKADEGTVWDAANLDAFLAKPKKWLKGTKMSFAGLKKHKDRAAIIAYLQSHSQ